VSKIWIDAGHGNNDPGAVGINNRREADDNLRLALLINERLKRAGYSTGMTRLTPTFTNNGRAAAANAWGADLYITIHRNAFEQASAHGFETFTKVNFTAGDDRIAQAVHRAVVKAGVQRDRGVKRFNFGSLLEARMPAILVEYNFVSNARDNELFDRNINAYADATVAGIREVFSVGGKEVNEQKGLIFGVPSQAATKNPNATTLHRVQVGSFGIRANAEAHLERIRAAGFPDAFIQTVQV
jgi:N-acetylmuramoyl-L-alanine amidase